MTKAATFEGVTRIVIVTDEGRAFDRYGIYSGGVEAHLQDGGRTLKLFPRLTVDD